MKVKEEVRAVGQLEAPLPLDAGGVERLKLIEQGRDVDHGAVPEEVLGVGIHDAAGKQVECKLVAVCDDRVASVCAAVEASDEVVAACRGRESLPLPPRSLLTAHALLRQDVTQLALALITPLASEDGADLRRHAGSFRTGMSSRGSGHARHCE